MPTSTVRAILKKFKATVHMHREEDDKRDKKIPKDICWRIPEEYSILGASSLRGIINICPSLWLTHNVLSLNFSDC